MNPVVNQKHILGIDILRFFAACLVVAFHYCFLMGTVPGGLVGKASQGIVKFPELYDFTNFGWVGVEIFFVISGFVIAFSGEKSTAFSFLRSRVVRLGPAVWICAPVTLIATALVGFRSNEIMFRAFRHSMAFLPRDPWIDGSYWTLGIEISFYLAVFLLIKFFNFGSIRFLATVIGLASSLFWIVTLFTKIEAIDLFSAQLKWLTEDRYSQLLLMHHGMFFALGVFLWAELIKKHDLRNVFWITLFCISGCAQIVGETAKANLDWNVNYSAITPCIIWLTSIALIIVFVRGNARLHALPPNVITAIQTAGMMTYPLYLLHQIVGAAMMGWMVTSGVDRWSALALTLIIIFALTWIVAKKAEPPLQAWTKYLITEAHDRYRSIRLRF